MNTRDPLEDLIKKSLVTNEEPSRVLNAALKAQVRERSHKTVSFWYLPMIANTILFLTIIALAQILIPSAILTKIIQLGSVYIIISGFVINLTAVKYFNFKEILSIEIRGN
jgi:hypothetical protein